jgi:flavin reductase (DIM6/NTAB) family NADH-FMN oxidoreductase RutF
MEAIDDFRLGMQRLASGVSVVTTASADGVRYGLTATSVFSLSLYPPSLVVGINKETRLGEVIPSVPAFAVSVLGAGHRHVAEAFAGRVSGLRGSARFAYGSWRYSTEGVPILDDSPASFTCKVGDIIERSTHLLVVGDVANVYIGRKENSLLVYSARRFSSISCAAV